MVKTYTGFENVSDKKLSEQLEERIEQLKRCPYFQSIRDSIDRINNEINRRKPKICVACGDAGYIVGEDGDDVTCPHCKPKEKNMTFKEIVARFFDGDKKLAKEVNLTKEEVKLFKNFEWVVLCDNGLSQINGGYSTVTVYDLDERDIGDTILDVEVSCGKHNTGDGHSNEDTWEVKFNRKTKKFIKEG